MPRPRAIEPTYSITKRATGYYVQWWQDGRACRISCRTKDAAEARRFLAEFKVGRQFKAPPAAPTIGAILDGYRIDRQAKPHSATLEQCCTTLKHHLADLPVDLLGKDQVRGYLTARRKEGARGASAKYRKRVRPLSDGTLIRELGTLRRALAWAVEEKWITQAPHVERPEAPPARDRWLTREEADRLIAGASAAHVRLFIHLALQTAARSGAILELTWDRIDMANGFIVLGRGRGLKRRATVPITDTLRHELTQAAEATTSQYVIEHGGKPVASIKTGFRAAVRRAGLRNVTPHVLRHTAATWMVQRAVPLAMVARYLGNTEKMVEHVYGHHAPEWLRQAAEALGGSSKRYSRPDNLENP